MRPATRSAIIGVLALLGSLAVAGEAPASAEPAPPGIVVSGGETQEAFGYTDAIRQRVWVESDFDSDSDGLDDLIAVDIIRPAATEQGLKVPVIMDASPYYTTLGRGNESQLKINDSAGLLAQWPLFLDNYSAAGWFGGKTGMIGKSYDSSLAAAAAATGVAGLTTIVDESGPYNYYDYTRSNGVI